MTAASSKSSEIHQLMAGFLELAGEMCFVCPIQTIPKKSVPLFQLRTMARVTRTVSMHHTKNSSSDNPTIRAGSHLSIALIYLYSFKKKGNPNT